MARALIEFTTSLTHSRHDGNTEWTQLRDALGREITAFDYDVRNLNTLASKINLRKIIADLDP
jgi:hypothetical protein